MMCCEYTWTSINIGCARGSTDNVSSPLGAPSCNLVTMFLQKKDGMYIRVYTYIFTRVLCLDSLPSQFLEDIDVACKQKSFEKR
jgi:hypothetical protein